MQIPNQILSLYDSFANDFIDSNFGVLCTIVYPSKASVCPNCIVDTINKKSTGIYKTGGPVSFTDSLCPVCSGYGYKDTEINEQIKLRVYQEKKRWIKVADSIVSSSAIAQIIGHRSDLSKIQQMLYIVLNSEYLSNGRIECVLDGPVINFGLTNKHFIAYLKQR